MYPISNNYPMINQQQIIRVNGENGARAYQLAPNSSALLLDETAPKIFLIQTDGAGYKSISRYKLEPCEEEKPVNMADYEARLQRLEEIINAKSNNSSIKTKQQ